jgi:sugar lactone lactonase YvrE
MFRQTLIITDLILTMITVVHHAQEIQADSKLIEVASFETYQPTGVAVSKTGRVFVNFPLWSDHHENSVVEVLPDGTQRPYPNEQWNSWREGSTSQAPSKAFVCVQSVWIDDTDTLWILDPASPRMEYVVPGGAKLVKVNLSNNIVEQVIPFEHEITPGKSYLNDVRIDTKRKVAYITESGLGAIIVVDLETSKARRLLAEHPSTKAEPIKLTVEGKELKDESGKTPQIHADGIALSPDGEFLYYHALTGKTLYRIPTRLLRDDGVPDAAIAEGVEKVGETVVTDGMLMDKAGNLYHTALDQNAIVRFTPEKKLETVITHDQIKWPDSLALREMKEGGPEIYFTTSQIHHMPRFNEGKETRAEPYHVFKMRLPEPEERVAADAP